MMKMKNFMKRNNADKAETILTFKNKFTGEFVYSSTKYDKKIIDGAEFIMVFPKPAAPNERRVNWMKKENLELVPSM